MAQRGITAGVIGALSQAQNEPVHLFEGYFDSSTVYATDAGEPIAWDGHTYQALGHFLGFDGIEETADLQVTQVTLRFTLADQTWIGIALNENYVDRRLVIRKGLRDGHGGVLLDPVPIFDGRMDGMRAEEDPQDGSGAVLVSATSHWSDFERRPGRHTNYEEQQLHFAGDRGFEFVSEINRPIQWGAA